jgi:hypothetical protein
MSSAIPGAQPVAPGTRPLEPVKDISSPIPNFEAGKVDQDNQTISSSTSSQKNSRTTGAFANMSDEERQLRYETKMALMDQQHEQNRENRASSSEQRASGEGIVEPIKGTMSPMPNNIPGVSMARMTAEAGLVAQDNQTLSSSKSSQTNSRTTIVFGNMSDEERQLRYETKMALMDRQHEQNRENRASSSDERPSGGGIGEPTLVNVRPSTSTENSVNQYDAKLRDMQQQYDDSAAKDDPAVEKAPQILAAHDTIVKDYNPANAYDDDYMNAKMGGNYVAAVSDNELAVAIAIEEGVEEEKNVAYAIEYDPDSKPPLYKNRRFRIYAVGGVLCFLVMVIVLVIILVTTKGDGKTVILTLEPTAAPTQLPTGTAERIFFEYVADDLGITKALDKKTPQYRATQWMIDEDPMKLEPADTNFLQRYMMAFIWFHTTDNGQSEWRSCNPPKDGEDNTCVFEVRNVMTNNTEYYSPQNNKVRWLSGESECTWVGVQCEGGPTVLGFELSKSSRDVSHD